MDLRVISLVRLNRDVPVPLALVPVAVFVAAAVSLLNFARLLEMKSVSATTIPEAPMRTAV